MTAATLTPRPTKRARQSITRALELVRWERFAQIAKWGTPDDPDDLADRPDGTGRPWDQMQAGLAKYETDTAAHDGRLTWRHILMEEVREAFAETDHELLRTELVQVAAVAVKWVEAIDRREDPS